MAMGKIPTYPEFLQTRTTREPAHSFDAWLEAGMGFANYQYGPAWAQAFAPGNVIGFVWRAPGATRAPSVLCGLLVPSRDSVGREYPLALACEIPHAALLHAPHVLPLALGDALESAHAATADLARVTPHEFAGRLASILPPNEHDVARALTDYDAWCAATPVESAWSAVFDVDPVESSVAIIHALASITTPVRGVESPTTGGTLRLPLGRGGPASATVWLDIVRRLCRWQTTIPSTFWTLADGNLVVALGDATPEVFAALWHPSPHVQDPVVAAPPSSAPPSPQTHPDDRNILRVDAPMTALLGSLSR